MGFLLRIACLTSRAKSSLVGRASDMCCITYFCVYLMRLFDTRSFFCRSRKLDQYFLAWLTPNHSYLVNICLILM